MKLTHQHNRVSYSSTNAIVIIYVMITGCRIESLNSFPADLNSGRQVKKLYPSNEHLPEVPEILSRKVICTKLMYEKIHFLEWNVQFQNIHLPKGMGSSQDEWAKVTLEPHSVVMNNYLGIGLDAAIALDFHPAREENLEKFSSR